MILVLDNYDSFVFNVARYIEAAGARTQVIRNDATTIGEIEAMAPDGIVLSPGPCSPAEAGMSLPVVRHFSGRLPILGICLGHQCIGEAFGGRTVHAKTPMHGRASAIAHDGTGLFAGLPSPLSAGRYHSLIVELGEDAPLAVTARSPDGEIMGLAHRAHPTYGLQFHPESILTEHGDALIRAFLDRLS
jgi:para-aminobenzoate synthetase component II